MPESYTKNLPYNPLNPPWVGGPLWPPQPLVFRNQVLFSYMTRIARRFEGRVSLRSDRDFEEAGGGNACGYEALWHEFRSDTLRNTLLLIEIINEVVDVDSISPYDSWELVMLLKYAVKSHGDIPYGVLMDQARESRQCMLACIFRSWYNRNFYEGRGK